MKSLCSTCNHPTNQKVLFEKKVGNTWEEEGWWETHLYQIIQCEGCETISFRKLYNDAQQDAYVDFHESGDPWTQELYPKRSNKSLPIRTHLNIPSDIKKVYRETIDAFNNEQPILCSVGIRAIIEGICSDKEIKGGECFKDGKKVFSRQLNGKIEGLHSSGYLTKSNSEILHELRFLGNQAVHELSSPSQEELKLAIEILEHTIENIYELQGKAKKLKEKIESRSKIKK